MIYGYARVSTPEQKLHLQIGALVMAGCEKIFEEKGSLTKKRPELEKLLAVLKEGDTLTVVACNRLSRTKEQLIDFVQCFQDKGVLFVSLQDGINSTSEALILLKKI